MNEFVELVSLSLSDGINESLACQATVGSSTSTGSDLILNAESVCGISEMEMASKSYWTAIPIAWTRKIIFYNSILWGGNL